MYFFHLYVTLINECYLFHANNGCMNTITIFEEIYFSQKKIKKTSLLIFNMYDIKQFD